MQSSALTSLLSRAMLPVLCFLVAAYFASHALFGTSGTLALDDIRREKAVLAKQQGALETREAELKRNIALLDPKGVDPDYADELVRRHLGVVRPDEVIVQLEKPAASR